VRFSVAALIVAIVLLAPIRLGSQVAEHNSGLVAGIVVDRNSGRPLPDAVVTIERHPLSQVGTGLPQRVVTDADGQFVFTSLPKSRVIVQTARAGYVADEATSVFDLDLADRPRIVDLRFQLVKGAAVTGRLLDETGDPVVDTSVQAHRIVYSGGRPFLDFAIAGRTDDRGIYRISNLMPGDYVVAVPYQSIAVPVSVLNESASADAAIKRTASLDVASLLPMIAPEGSTRAERRGDFVLQSPPGTLLPHLSRDPDGVLTYRTTFAPSSEQPVGASVISLEPGGEVSGIDIRLMPLTGLQVSGKVSSTLGPIGRVTLRLIDMATTLPDSAASAVASVLSDGSGAFTFLNVPPGSYRIRAQYLTQSRTLLWADESISVGRASIANVVVTLRPAATMRGRVEFKGSRPGPTADELRRLQLRQQFVRLQPADSRASNKFYSAEVDASGSFTFDVDGSLFLVVPTTVGAWTLKTATLGSRDLTVSAVGANDVIDGVVITFTDDPVKVEGTVTTSAGSTAQGGTVMLFPANERDWTYLGRLPRRFFSATTASGGAYSFSPVPAGEYFLAAVIEMPSTDLEAVKLPGALRDWMNPAVLSALAKQAVRIHVEDTESVRQDLRAIRVR